MCIRDRLKKRFALLTDNDLLFADDRKAEMWIKLETKLGKSKEELQKIMSAL